MRGESVHWRVESDDGGLLIEFAEIFHRLLDTQIWGLHKWE